MDTKKKLYICICGVLAIVLVCVVLVGLINGFWPWSGSGFGNNYQGKNNTVNEDTTAGTDDTTVSDDTTQTDATQDSTGTTTNSGNNQGGGTGSGGNGGGSGNGASVVVEGDDIKIDLRPNKGDGDSEEDETESTQGTEPQEPPKPTVSSGAELDFNDFFNP